VNLAQHERKGNDKQFISKVINYVQDPAAPVLRATCRN